MKKFVSIIEAIAVARNSDVNKKVSHTELICHDEQSSLVLSLKWDHVKETWLEKAIFQEKVPSFVSSLYGPSQIVAVYNILACLCVKTLGEEKVAPKGMMIYQKIEIILLEELRRPFVLSNYHSSLLLLQNRISLKSTCLVIVRRKLLCF